MGCWAWAPSPAGGELQKRHLMSDVMLTTDQISRKSIHDEPRPAIGTRGKLAYVAMVIGGVVLAVTGIGAFVFGKAPMSQWVLMAHVAAAPLFAIGLAGVALTWADACRFGGA